MATVVQPITLDIVPQRITKPSLVMCDMYRYMEVLWYSENITIQYSMLVYQYFIHSVFYCLAL